MAEVFGYKAADGLFGEFEVDVKLKEESILGSRNRSDLYIAANSNRSNSAYEPLLNYCGNYPEANYSTSIIHYGYYPQAQYNN